MRVGQQAQVAPAERPSEQQHSLVTTIALSAGAGIVADRLRRQALARGQATSVVLGLAGAATVKAVAEGALRVMDNQRHDRDLADGLGSRMLDGARTGLIDGGLTLAAAPLHASLAARLPRASTVRLAATTGLILGGAGGALNEGTRSEVWRHGAVHGLTTVGIATAFGGTFGLALGGAVGGIAQRFAPRYQGGPANAHQVRTLVAERGSSAAKAMNPIHDVSWEATTANAAKVTRMVLPAKQSPSVEAAAMPEMQAFLQDLKAGDVILVAKGSRQIPKDGLNLQMMETPYSHAMMVVEAPHGGNPGKVVHAEWEGVIEESVVDAMGHYMPHGGRPQSAFSLVRPTRDSRTAELAVAFARERVGKPYNFTTSTRDPGYFCSQLIHQAYDQNPAISRPPLKLLQLEEDGNRIAIVRGIGENGGLWELNKKMLLGTYKAMPLPQRVGAMVRDGARTVVGAVSYGAGQVKAAVSKTGGKVYPTDYRYQAPEFVSPGDLDLADGRKLQTLVVESLGKPRHKPSLVSQIGQKVRQLVDRD